MTICGVTGNALEAGAAVIRLVAALGELCVVRGQHLVHLSEQR